MHKRLKKVGLWALVIAFFLGTLGGEYMTMRAYAVTTATVNLSEVHSQMNQAAKLYVVASAMDFCVEYGVAHQGLISETRKTLNSEFLRANKNIFNGNQYFYGGSWLENQVQGKIDDGAIYCSNGDGGKHITQLFSETFGYSFQQIYCDKDDTGKNGILTRNGSDGKDCDRYLSQGDNASYQVSSGAQSYIRKLYEEYRNNANNPYIAEWRGAGMPELSAQSGGIQYYIYLRDMRESCITSQEATTNSYTTFSIPEITNHGEKIHKDYIARTEQKSAHTYSGNTDEGVVSCENLISELSNASNAYRSEIKSAIKHACYNAMDGALQQKISELNAIVMNQDGSYTQETIDNAIAKIDEIKAMYNDLSLETFIEEYRTTGNSHEYQSGWQCKQVEDIEISYVSGTSGDPSGSDNDTVKATCTNSLGSSLGWAICGIADLVSEAIQTIYESVIEPSLSVKTSLFYDSNGNRTATFTAWGAFRDLANVVFVIYLLVVIFSQLTGIGIDNYGIKKTLPKLIVAAVMVNLSYFICQLAVDISNILGSNLYNYLSSLGADNVAEYAGSFGWEAAASIGITATVAGAIGAGLFFAIKGGLLTITLGTFIPIFTALIGALVGVLFMFFLLGLRQALVVMLVVLSPLAFVCYIFPNTKNIFDKWKNLGFGMLLLYPICSLAIGGGRLASNILIGSRAAADNFFVLITAIIAEIGPFFLVPSLTKGAFKATGAIGGRLMGWGANRKMGAQRRFLGSRAVRDLGARHIDAAENNRDMGISRRFERNKRWAGGTTLKVDKKTGNVKEVKASRLQRLIGRAGSTQNAERRAILAQSAIENRERARQKISSEGQRQNLLSLAREDPANISQEALENRLEGALMKGEAGIDEAVGITDFMMGRLGGSKGSDSIRNVLEKLEDTEKNPDVARNFLDPKNNTRRGYLNAISMKHGRTIAAKDAALGRTVNTGGFNAITGNLERTVDLNTIRAGASGGLELNAFKDEELATLGKKSIKSMYMTGQITADNARRILANDNLTSGMDNESRAMWTHIAEGGSDLFNSDGSPVATTWGSFEDGTIEEPVLDADGHEVKDESGKIKTQTRPNIVRDLARVVEVVDETTGERKQVLERVKINTDSGRVRQIEEAKRELVVRENARVVHNEAILRKAEEISASARNEAASRSDSRIDYTRGGVDSATGETLDYVMTDAGIRVPVGQNKNGYAIPAYFRGREVEWSAENSDVALFKKDGEYTGETFNVRDSKTVLPTRHVFEGVEYDGQPIAVPEGAKVSNVKWSGGNTFVSFDLEQTDETGNAKTTAHTINVKTGVEKLNT